MTTTAPTPLPHAALASLLAAIAATPALSDLGATGMTSWSAETTGRITLNIKGETPWPTLDALADLVGSSWHCYGLASSLAPLHLMRADWDGSVLDVAAPAVRR